MDAEAWNERYRAATVWSGKPNEALVAHVPAPRSGTGDGTEGGRRPTALDLGCGEGADALWLASQGWSVVGVDWAGVALQRARAAALAAGLDARFVEGDVRDAAFLAGLSATGTFDLITVGFLHPEPEGRASMFAHLPRLVAPGGSLLVLAHDPEHGERGLPGPPQQRLLSSAQIVGLLDLPEDCTVDVASRHTRRVGETVAALDSVVLVRRGWPPSTRQIPDWSR